MDAYLQNFITKPSNIYISAKGLDAFLKRSKGVLTTTKVCIGVSRNLGVHAEVKVASLLLHVIAIGGERYSGFGITLDHNANLDICCLTWSVHTNHFSHQ